MDARHESSRAAPLLGRLPGPARLAVAAFVLILGGGYALAHATLWQAEGGGRLPGPDDVLAAYHGDPRRSRLHTVLAADVPATSPRAMWHYLDPAGDPAIIAGRRAAILGWVEQGAPREGWSGVAQILHTEATCLTCHGFGGERQDLPFETFEQVQVVARPGAGRSVGALLVSAHAHAFGFALLALVLGLLVAATRLPRRLQALLILAAFLGAALDVGAWFLTQAHGSPWQYAVIAGGALFGASCTAMALAALLEVLRRPPPDEGALRG